MNQGENTESISSVEKNQITDQPLSVASWTTQGENHNLRENGAVSSSRYNHDQPPAATLETVQDGSNVASTVSTSTAAQDYNGYAAYPNTEPNGYNNMRYAAYYNQYQQPNQYQQQTNQDQQQHNPYQQQPNHYYQLPVQYQVETSQHQPQTNQYQQQPNQSYPHHVGAYQNTDVWKLHKWHI